MKKVQENANFSSLDLEEFLPQDLIKIHPHSPSLHYSHAIFEGMSLIKVDRKLHLFHPWLNLERMRHNANEVGIDMRKFADKKIIENIFSLAALNGFHNGRLRSPVIQRAGKSVNRFYVRPLLFVEADSIGLGANMTPHLLLSTMQMGEYLRYEKEKGIDVMLYPFPRTLQLPSVKTASNYQIGIVSRLKMKQFNQRYNERCSETIFENSNGDIIEGSGENVILLRENEIISPNPKEGAIPGITLRMLSIIAQKFGLKFRFGTFKLSDLHENDCLFLSGNAAGIIPVASIAEVDGEFGLRKWHRLRSAENELFQKLRNEYEMMETAQGEYSKYHACMDDWIDDAEKERLFSCAERFMQKVERISRKGICDFAGASPRPSIEHAFCANSILGNFGLKNFYGEGRRG